MNIQGHDTNEKVFIIAEIGNNHEGDFELAKKMIRLAFDSGADAVKFQTIIPEYLVSNDDIHRLERLNKYKFSYKQFSHLSEYAKKLGIIFFSTPFDINSARFLNRIQSFFKISSGDNTFYPLVDLISNFGKPIIISTGTADLKEIDNLYDRIYDLWNIKSISSELALLHCVSSYPVPDKEANISAILELKDKYPKATIGYSDHTLGIDAVCASVSIGARIIEKHFTTDKNYSDFQDHQLSADPMEFRDMVKKIRRIETLMGSGKNNPQKCEKAAGVSMRRSIASNKKLKAGTKITFKDITWVRPGKGIPPGNEKIIIDRELINSLEAGQIISIKDFQQ